MTTIECVPNVSEGQRRGVVAALARALDAVPGVRLLDYSADATHHRSVFTLVGTAAPLTAAVLELYRLALDAIDLRQHHGAHPRIGAVDVVPFIPLGDTPLEACVSLARDVGRAVADRFAVPVFLYEAAATSAARRALEQIRRGQFEGLTEKLTHPDWQPDFGPHVPHVSAGASAVGARGALIAWNVNLTTSRLDVAQRVARAVRHSSGGLPCVKAIGLRLSDRTIVQVSINLTDYRTTPMTAVMDRIREEAGRLGAAVLDSKIIGLVPENALPDDPGTTLALARFSPDQILERRLRG